MKRFNIAILTHNAMDYTKMCLSSITEFTHIDHDIFVLDNASIDDTPEWLTTRTATNMHVVTSRTNFGVPGGRNFLLFKIMQHLPDDGLIIFLDNDVEVQAGWYEPFLELFASHPQIGIAGASGHEIIIHPEWRELMASPVDLPAPVDVVSGFCFWVRAETVDAVGLFDENLGMFWHEDDDYCIRAINLGFEVFMVPGTQIVHYGHKSGVAEAAISQGGSPENQRYLIDKWRQLGVVDSEGRIIHCGR